MVPSPSVVARTRAVLTGLAAFTFPILAQDGSRDRDLWVSAYYAGWMQGWENYGLLPAQEIDYTALTHIIHFGLVPRSDGSVDSLANSMTEVNSRELVREARRAGVKTLICIGGWGTDAAFVGATSPLNLERFLDNLVGFMERRGYDGIDVDWEYLRTSDAVPYVQFIKRLRARLDALSPRPLLTAATAWHPEILAPLSGDFDQINIMTYDLSGAWPGWVAWHNSPIFDGGFVFPSTLRPVPSADGMVQQFKTAGISAGKLSIGIDFYGYVWNGGDGTSTGGVTAPRQSWILPPFVRPNVPYYRIWEDYYGAATYRWDSLAQAPYLSIDSAGSTHDKFVSFCDERSAVQKINYAKEKGLGGVFIWELGGGYLSEQYPDRDRLLQAVKNAAKGQTAVLPPPAPSLLQPANGSDDIPTETRFAWEGSPGTYSYRIQISESPLFRISLVDDSTLIEPLRHAYLQSARTYYWRVSARNGAGWGPFSPLWAFTTADDGTTPTPKPNPAVPLSFGLHQNYPNPFNGQTNIRFDLPEPSTVLVEIYSVDGKLMEQIADGEFAAGSHVIPWSPHKSSPTGIYFYRILTSGQGLLQKYETFQETRRLIYVK